MRKSDSLLDLLKHQADIDNIYLYAKDPLEEKYHLLINKREIVVLMHCKDYKVFIKYFKLIDDIYKNIDE